MSSINPVSRSMNGIKTIETAEVIFTDDNSSLNTSAGIVQAQANSTTALNGKINSVDFNTLNGVLTLNKEDGGTLTKDLDGRYFEGTTLSATDIPNLPAGKITSDTFDEARIPDLNASKITAGTLGTDRIPDLDAGKITTGTLDTARIPDLNASKITAGTLGTDRIPTDLSTYVRVGTAGTHTDETIYGVKTFNEPPECSTAPTSNDQLANKSYVDTQAGTPANMMTTDTAQTITELKTFNTLPRSNLMPTHSYDLTRKGYIDNNFLLQTGGTLSGQLNLDAGCESSFINARGTNASLSLRAGTQGSAGGISIFPSGNVGINQTSDNGAKLMVYGHGNGYKNQSSYNMFRRHLDRTSGTHHNINNIGGCGIYTDTRCFADGGFWAIAGSLVASDVRIKENIEEVNGNESIEKLKKLKPVSYSHKDFINRGSDKTYGFIAQEVKEVIPESIKCMEQHIPDIYKGCDVSGDILKIDDYDVRDLSINTNLLIKMDTADIEKRVNVIDIDVSNNSVKIDETINADECFVFGRKVKDYHSLEKDHIWTITTASVIELIKRVEALEKQVEDMK
jgi:hypothetical protein